MFSRLPSPATESGIHGDSALTHTDDVDVYFGDASGLLAQSGLYSPNSNAYDRPAFSSIDL